MSDVPVRWPDPGSKVRVTFKRRGKPKVVEATVVDTLHRFCVLDTGLYRVTIHDSDVRMGLVEIREVKAS